MLVTSQLASDAARHCAMQWWPSRFWMWLCSRNHPPGCPLQPGIERRYNRQESRNSQFSGNSGNADSSVHGINEARRSAELHGSEFLLGGLHSPSLVLGAYGMRCCMAVCCSLMLASPGTSGNKIGRAAGVQLP